MVPNFRDNKREEKKGYAVRESSIAHPRESLCFVFPTRFDAFGS